MSIRQYIVLFLLSVSCSIYAQSYNGGIVLGACASHTTGYNIADSSIFSSNSMITKVFQKPGLNVGFFTNLSITEHSIIDFEISYIQKGARCIDTASTASIYQSVLRLHYITIPIHYKYKFNNYFSVFAGPNLGILMKYRYFQNYIEYSDLYDNISPVDFALDIGFSVGLLEKLSIDVKYSGTFFLTPILSYNNPDSWSLGPFSKQFWQKGQCNQLIAFTLRWVFFGKEKRPISDL
ncbi:MAG: outer membrane beta-barrel protein [Bacteroidales bacterium]|nr:outer membrane beta-barrel protein [Bacteroidales bacterium]